MRYPGLFGVFWGVFCSFDPASKQVGVKESKMNFLVALNFELIFKIVMICFLAFLTFLASLLVRQISLLNQFLATVLGGFLKFIALLFFGVLVGTLILCILTL